MKLEKKFGVRNFPLVRDLEMQGIREVPSFNGFCCYKGKYSIRVWQNPGGFWSWSLEKSDHSDLVMLYCVQTGELTGIFRGNSLWMEEGHARSKARAKRAAVRRLLHSERAYSS